MSALPKTLEVVIGTGDNVVVYDESSFVRANLSAALTDYDRVESEPFAAELARRWNAHEELVAACQAALARYEDRYTGTANVGDLLEAAIAKAVKP